MFLYVQLSFISQFCFSQSTYTSLIHNAEQLNCINWTEDLNLIRLSIELPKQTYEAFCIFPVAELQTKVRIWAVVGAQ